MSEINDNKDTYALQSNLTGEAASQLADELLGLEGSALSVNAAQVERMDTPAVQVLVAASKLWAERNQAFEIAEPSEAVSTTFNQLGLQAYLHEGS